MRRILLVLLALLGFAETSVAQGFVQYVPASTFTAPVLISDGTSTSPSIAFASDPDTGIFYSADASGMQFGFAGTQRVGIYSSSVKLINSEVVGWTSGVLAGAQDTMISRPAPATFQLGGVDAASPVAQTVQAQGVAAGTSDVAGAALTIRPGVGRGSAIPANLTLNRSLITASGNGAQPQQSAIVVCGSKTLSTTSATAQTIVTVPTTTLTGGGLTLYYGVHASSATAVDAATGSVHVSWNNVSGTVAATMGTVINEVQSNSSGTLAATPTVTVATNVVSVKLTPTWVTIVPTTVRGFFIVLNESLDPIGCQ